MSLSMEDRSGTIRDPEDFVEAKKVIMNRMIKAGAVPQDAELFVQFTTIIQALEIAERVSRSMQKKKAGG